ncbi:MAG: carboxymuconolactone decarboxylase family protein [Armatimonas sp.]
MSEQATRTQRFDFSAQSKKQYEQLFGLSRAVKQTSELDAGLLHLVDIRASLINGCAFCLDMHVKEARAHGERELRIYHVPIWEESTLFTPKERAAFRWTEIVTRVSEAGVSEEDYAQAREHFSEKELSDLTFAVATINTWNRLAIASGSVPGSMDKAYGLDKAGLN